MDKQTVRLLVWTGLGFRLRLERDYGRVDGFSSGSINAPRGLESIFSLECRHRVGGASVIMGAVYFLSIA